MTLFIMYFLFEAILNLRTVHTVSRYFPMEYGLITICRQGSRTLSMETYLTGIFRKAQVL